MAFTPLLRMKMLKSKRNEIWSRYDGELVIYFHCTTWWPVKSALSENELKGVKKADWKCFLNPQGSPENTKYSNWRDNSGAHAKYLQYL